MLRSGKILALQQYCIQTMDPIQTTMIASGPINLVRESWSKLMAARIPPAAPKPALAPQLIGFF
jgi:hypothetical protein